MKQIRIFVFMVHFNKKWHFIKSNYIKSLNSASKFIGNIWSLMFDAWMSFMAVIEEFYYLITNDI
jgi:hypothetical protein